MEEEKENARTLKAKSYKTEQIQNAIPEVSGSVVLLLKMQRAVVGDFV